MSVNHRPQLNSRQHSGLNTRQNVGVRFSDLINMRKCYMATPKHGV